MAAGIRRDVAAVSGRRAASGCWPCGVRRTASGAGSGPLTDLVRDGDRPAGRTPPPASPAASVEERLNRLAEPARLDARPAARIDLLTAAVVDARSGGRCRRRRPVGAWTGVASGDSFDCRGGPVGGRRAADRAGQGEPDAGRASTTCTTRRRRRSTRSAPCCPRSRAPSSCCCSGRPELVRTAGALTRVADAEVANLPALRGADAARLLSDLSRRRPAATGRHRPAARDRPGQPVLPGRTRHAADRARRADRSRPTRATGGWRLAAGSLGGALLSRDLAAVLAARIDALPADARAVLRDATVVGDTVPAGALEALHERRTGRTARAGAAARRVGARRRGVAVPAHAAAGARRVRLRDAAAARGGLRRHRQGRPGRTARVPGSLGGRRAHSGSGWVRSVGTEADADAFIADHVERAVALADAVDLRPDAPARSVAPLGVAALGRAARRAINIGRAGPGGSLRRARRPLTGDVLPLCRSARLRPGAAAARPAERGAGAGREADRRCRRATTTSTPAPRCC